MKAEDIEYFAKIMIMLSEVYGDGREPSDLKKEVYFSALKRYDIGVLKHAIEHMIMVRVFPSFPKPGEIIQEIEGTKQSRAVMAWTEVVDAIRKTGPYVSVKFTDPVIHSVIEFMGGWPSLGDWLEDELKWKQKEFERLYEAMSNSPRGKAPGYLPGIHELQNSNAGYLVDRKVVTIGGGQGGSTPMIAQGTIQ